MLVFLLSVSGSTAEVLLHMGHYDMSIIYFSTACSADLLLMSGIVLLSKYQQHPEQHRRTQTDGLQALR